jgi:hypothetical protein
MRNASNDTDLYFEQHIPPQPRFAAIVGNAIYVLHKDWERWSRMTKQELMADESREVVRIVHRPGWFERVRQELGTPMTADSRLPDQTDGTNSLDEPDTSA